MDAITPRSSRTRWRRLIEQLGTLALSIVLALIVWLIAINQQDPLIQGEYSERVPVTVRGLGDGLQPVQDLSKETVRVVLRAPRSSWDNLTLDDFYAYINLAGLSQGVHDVDVTVEVVDPRVDILTVTRPELRVQIDRVAQKEVPVRVDVMDSTAFGFDWQTPLVTPMTVTVRGPETQVTQVSVAVAEVYLRNAKNQVERTQTLVAQNAQEQPVQRVEMSPPEARIIVPVEEWPGRKEVAVRVNLEGQPAPGYRLSTVRVNPSTVVLLGSADVLAAVPGFVETEPVALAGATNEIQRRLQLRVPEGVTVLEGRTVDVTASITPIQGGATIRQAPVIQGLDAGLEANVALDTLDVILSGPLPLLESLGADDVFVILDLTGLLPGNHTVTPRVVAPTEIRAEGVIPERVEVVITVRSTPDADAGLRPPATPTVTPAATITATLNSAQPAAATAEPSGGDTP